MDAAPPTRLVLWVTVDEHGNTWFSARADEGVGRLEGDEVVPLNPDSTTDADVAVYSLPSPLRARSAKSAHPRGWLWTAAIAVVIGAGLLVSLHGRPSTHRSTDSAPAASMPAGATPSARAAPVGAALVDDVIMGLRPESVLLLRRIGG